jgi:hypothetical protein
VHKKRELLGSLFYISIVDYFFLPGCPFLIFIGFTGGRVGFSGFTGFVGKGLGPASITPNGGFGLSSSISAKPGLILIGSFGGLIGPPSADVRFPSPCC